MKVTPVCRGGNTLISPPHVEEHTHQQISDRPTIRARQQFTDETKKSLSISPQFFTILVAPFCSEFFASYCPI
jgi:hypothetical protein